MALWDEIDERNTRPARVARFHASLPTIFHSVWRAPDCRVAAVLVNWTRKPQPYELKTPDLTISGTLSPPVDGNVSNSERLLRHIRMIRTIAFIKTVVV